MLTDTEIRRSKPKEAAYRLTDGKGLYMQVTPAGGRLWRWKYRFKGLEKLMSFGTYPDVSLLDARERHAAGRKLLAAGIDPMAARKLEKVTVTLAVAESFRAVGALWFAHWSVDKSQRHADTTRRRLDANVYPTLGDRPIGEIKAPELVAMVKSIEARGVGDLAKRALETCGQIFRFAIAHGHCDRNPAADIKPADVLRPVRKTNLARIDAKELPALLRAIEVYRGKVVTRLAIKLMALTFVRTSELIEARWSEFDLSAPGRFGEIDRTQLRWNIPAERMKMKTPHIVPLSSQALQVLELLKGVTGDAAYLFPNDMDRKRPMSNNAILSALERMGYKGQMTGHGFRGLASTILHEQGYDHAHIELQLAHTRRDSVSAAYNHALYLEPRAKMMSDWGNYLERSLLTAP